MPTTVAGAGTEEVLGAEVTSDSELTIDDSTLSALFPPLSAGSIADRVSAIKALGSIDGPGGNISSTLQLLEEMDDERIADITRGK